MAVKNAKKILSLKRRKGRQAEQKYLIEGIRLCEEALASSDTLEQLVFCRESIARNKRLENLYQTAIAQGIPIQQTNWRAFKGMSDTHTPQGVLGVVAMRTWDRASVLNTDGPFLILDRISDPGNLGVIMRTAEAAACAGIFLTRGSVELHNPKVVRATMGAIFRLPIFPLQNGCDLLRHLRQRNIAIIAAHIDGTVFHELNATPSVALLLGNEAFGIDPAYLAMADHTVTIPMAAPVESLNIAVASGILLYKICELTHRRSAR